MARVYQRYELSSDGPIFSTRAEASAENRVGMALGVHRVEEIAVSSCVCFSLEIREFESAVGSVPNWVSSIRRRNEGLLHDRSFWISQWSLLFLCRGFQKYPWPGERRGLSATLRSSTISQLPVPLNSSKITSSIREPVSMSAVAMIDSEPPSSIFRAAPKNRLGRCKAFASTPPVSHLAGRWHNGVERAAKTRDRIEQDDHIALVFDKALGFLDNHFSYCYVPGGRFIKGRGDDLAFYRALHIRHLFRALVDQQNDQVTLRVIFWRCCGQCSATARFYPCVAGPRSERADLYPRATQGL